jgi:Ycf66 protein N-terminus
VNFGTSAPLLIGLILVVASLGLLLTSKFKPELHQESDNVYAIIGVICGLFLMGNLDLNIGMSFQQMLMVGSVVTLMWQFVQVRAENKRLKGGGGGRSNSREPISRRSGYAAKIDEEPEYAPPARNASRRLNSDRQDQWNNYDDEYDQPVRDNGRMLPEYRRADQVDEMPRQRSEYSDYEASEPRDYNRRSNADNADRQQPPAAENRSRRSRRSNSAEPATPSRNRRRSSIDDAADEPAAKSSAYVDYEPVEPTAAEGVEKPLQFPDQY